MPEPRSPRQDISRSSSPWRGTRRSPVICSLPSLFTNPTLPCPACLTHEWTDRIHSPGTPKSVCVRSRSSRSGKNHPQMLHPTTEPRSVSTRGQSFLFPPSHFWRRNQPIRGREIPLKNPLYCPWIESPEGQKDPRGGILGPSQRSRIPFSARVCLCA